MRIYRIEHGGEPRYARSIDTDRVELLDGPPWLGGVPTGTQLALAEARLLAPVSPSKIVGVGRNYAAHAKELGNEVPTVPLIFLKPPSSLAHPEQAIELPSASERVEHEAEIGLVIGRRVRNANHESARAAIFGVTCVNDVTARDLQRKDVQFTRAKGFDTFCPVGPYVETQVDLQQLKILGRVNGVVRQSASVEQMVFPLVELVSFISSVMTLEPGDLIATGTPEGVGPLQAGDHVEIEIPGIALLRNGVVRSDV